MPPKRKFIGYLHIAWRLLSVRILAPVNACGQRAYGRSSYIRGKIFPYTSGYDVTKGTKKGTALERFPIGLTLAAPLSGPARLHGRGSCAGLCANNLTTIHH